MFSFDGKGWEGRGEGREHHVILSFYTFYFHLYTLLFPRLGSCWPWLDGWLHDDLTQKLVNV